MTYNFSDAPTQQSGGFEPLPEGTLAYAVINIKPDDKGSLITTGRNGQAQYLNLELTICSGPYAKRKVFERIGWAHADKGETGDKYRNMGKASIRAILEVGRQAFQNPANYQISGPQDLLGTVCAVKLGIKPESKDEKTGRVYAAQNTVKMFLSPNPDSNSHKDYLYLVAQHGNPPAGNITGGIQVRPNVPVGAVSPAAMGANPLNSQEPFAWQ